MKELKKAVAQLDRGVLPRHGRIRELHEVALAAPHTTPAHRQLELAAGVGALDHDEAGQ